MDELNIRPLEKNRVFKTFEKRIPENIYCLTSFKSPGTVVIYNHYSYPNAPHQLSNRDGTHKDVAKLKSLFTSLKFDVHSYDDLTSEEIKEKLLHHISTVDWENSGSLVLIVLTHGEENGMLWASDKLYHCSQLWDPILQEDKLKDTFKFIVLQACRGYQREKRFNVMKLLKSQPAELIDDETKDEPPRKKFISDEELITYRPLPDKATNLLIAHSTVEGCASIRNTDEGTWYVHTFCNIIGTQWSFHGGHDILEAMTLINYNLTNFGDRTSAIQKGQTTSYTSYLHENITYGEGFSSPMGNIILPTKTYKGRAYIYYDKNHEKEAKEFAETWNTLLFLPILHEIDHGETALKHMADVSYRNDFYHENFVIFAVFTKCETIINNNIPLKHIYNNFSAEKCPSLAGQMKLFFFFDMKYDEKLETELDFWLDGKNTYITNHADFLIVRGHSKEFLQSLNYELLNKTYTAPFYHMVLILTTAMASETRNHNYSTNIESTLAGNHCLAPFEGAQLPRSLLQENKILKPVYLIELKEPYSQFTGREEELRKLVKETSSKNPGKKIIKISGMSGVGKTQLAAMFTKYYVWMFNNLIWINCETEQSLQESFQEVAIKLGLCERDDNPYIPTIIPTDINMMNLVTSIYEFLKNQDNHKTLFVFDNYVDIASKYLPQHIQTSEIYHIITTNMTSNSISTIEGQEIEIPINCFDNELSIKLLKKVLHDVYNPDVDLEKLADKLGYLPLLLQLSASYIRENQLSNSDYKITDFLLEFEEDPQKVTNKELELELNQATYHYTFYRVCQMKITKIESNKIAYALPILYLVSYCESDDIPLSIFHTLSELKGKSNEKTTERDKNLRKQKINNALITLINESLIFTIEKSNLGNIHRLLQECIRHIVREKNKETNVFDTALNLIKCLLLDCKKLDGFETHAIRLFEQAFKHDFKENHVETALQFAKYLQMNTKLGLALNFLKSCTEVFELKFGINSQASLMVKGEMMNVLSKNVKENLNT